MRTLRWLAFGLATLVVALVVLVGLLAFLSSLGLRFHAPSGPWQLPLLLAMAWLVTLALAWPKDVRPLSTLRVTGGRPRAVRWAVPLAFTGSYLGLLLAWLGVHQPRTPSPDAPIYWVQRTESRLTPPGDRPARVALTGPESGEPLVLLGDWQVALDQEHAGVRHREYEIGTPPTEPRLDWLQRGAHRWPLVRVPAALPTDAPVEVLDPVRIGRGFGPIRVSLPGERAFPLAALVPVEPPPNPFPPFAPKQLDEPGFKPTLRRPALQAFHWAALPVERRAPALPRSSGESYPLLTETFFLQDTTSPRNLYGLRGVLAVTYADGIGTPFLTEGGAGVDMLGEAGLRQAHDWLGEMAERWRTDNFAVPMTWVFSGDPPPRAAATAWGLLRDRYLPAPGGFSRPGPDPFPFGWPSVAALVGLLGLVGAAGLALARLRRT
jgi:hypothetical protein